MKRLGLVAIAAVAVAASCGDQVLLDPSELLKPQFDDIGNNIDATVDATAEVMALTAGGANGTTQLYVTPQNGDGKNGCNLTGSTTLVIAVSSSNTAAATVSPASVTFTSCGDTPTLTVTPLSFGSATISVTQTSNSSGGTFNLAPATFTVNVATALPTNYAPELGPIGDKQVDEGSELTFTAGASDDPGQALTFSLLNAPGGAAINSTTGVFSWTPDDGPSGFATFKVRVADNGSPVMTDEEEITVTVDNVAPSATFNSPATANQGESFSLSLTAPADPSDADVAAGFTYAFDCGSGWGAYGAASSVTCAGIASAGEHTVKGRIRDKDLGVTEYSGSLNVVNRPPTATLTAPATGNEGSALNFSVTASDPEGDALTIDWDFGDGTTIAGGAAAVSHAYADNGTYTVTVTVSATGGSDVETASVAIANVSPTATFVVPAGTVSEGSPFALSLTDASDPSSVDVAAGLQYAFDCGTGSYGSFGSAASVNCPTTDNASLAVKARVKDKDGGVSDYAGSVTVVNVAPTATFVTPAGNVNEGSSFNLGLTNPVEPSPVDATSLEYAFDCGSGYGSYGAAATVSCPTNDNGNPAVKAKVRDKDGGESEYTGSVTVVNVAPTATFGATPTTLNEDGSFALSLTNPVEPSTADAASLTYAFDCGTGYGPFGASASISCTPGNPGTPLAKAKIRDKDGGETAYQQLITVNDIVPVITSVTPSSPLIGMTSAGAPATINVAFTGWAGDGNTGTVNCDGGQAGNFSGPVSPSSFSHTCNYREAGVYTITATIADDDGTGTDDTETYQYVVVYDPSAGFVTGGGWINYGTTACPVLCGGAAGRGDFGFVSKYLKGANVPTGNTAFEFHAGTLKFVSSSYEWLVVAGTRAQFKGEGRINGGSDVYGFLLTAIDGGTRNPDAFRIKIWKKFGDGVVVFDNQMGADEDTPAATTLDKVSGNGSIVIHAK